LVGAWDLFEATGISDDGVVNRGQASEVMPYCSILR
jgi:hypothetical protein